MLVCEVRGQVTSLANLSVSFGKGTYERKSDSTAPRLYQATKIFLTRKPIESCRSQTVLAKLRYLFGSTTHASRTLIPGGDSQAFGVPSVILRVVPAVASRILVRQLQIRLGFWRVAPKVLLTSRYKANQQHRCHEVCERKPALCAVGATRVVE